MNFLLLFGEFELARIWKIWFCPTFFLIMIFTTTFLRFFALHSLSLWSYSTTSNYLNKALDLNTRENYNYSYVLRTVRCVRCFQIWSKIRFWSRQASSNWGWIDLSAFFFFFCCVKCSRAPREGELYTLKKLHSVATAEQLSIYFFLRSTNYNWGFDLFCLGEKVFCGERSQRTNDIFWPSSIRHTTLVFFVVAYWNTNFHSARHSSESRLLFRSLLSALRLRTLSCFARSLLPLSSSLLSTSHEKMKKKQKEKSFHLVARAIFSDQFARVNFSFISVDHSCTSSYHIGTSLYEQITLDDNKTKTTRRSIWVEHSWPVD